MFDKKMNILKSGLPVLALMLCVVNCMGQKIVLKNINKALLIEWNNKQRLLGGVGLIQNSSSASPIESSVMDDVALLSLKTNGDSIKSDGFAGVFFKNIPDLKQGITLWRYKPWNSWSKPVRVLDATKMQEWDVQFFYWQYKDGTYGAAVPLSGNGFRTTLGSENNLWGSKAVSYASNRNADLGSRTGSSFRQITV
jgi:hypothetical protein